MSIVTPCTWRARASRWNKWPERVRQSGKLNRCLQLALSWLLGHFVFNMFQTAHSSQSMGQIKAAASEAGIDWCSTALSDDESRPSLSLSLSLWQSRRMSSGLRVCNLPGPYSGVLSQKFKYFPFQLTECPLLLPRHAATHLWALKSCQSRIFMVGRAQTIKIFILIATTVPTFPSKRTN